MPPPTPEPSPKAIDWQVELARQRNRLASDRTLLAWIRTSSILISFGFGLDQGSEALRIRLQATVEPAQWGHLLGLALVGLGSYIMLMAALNHHQELQRLHQSDYQYLPRRALGATVAVVLLVIGISAFISIAFRTARFAAG